MFCVRDVSEVIKTVVGNLRKSSSFGAFARKFFFSVFVNFVGLPLLLSLLFLPTISQPPDDILLLIIIIYLVKQIRTKCFFSFPNNTTDGKTPMNLGRRHLIACGGASMSQKQRYCTHSVKLSSSEYVDTHAHSRFCHARSAPATQLHRRFRRLYTFHYLHGGIITDTMSRSQTAGVSAGLLLH